MKLRVTYAKRSYKDKAYTTPLVQYSYRDENGVPRHKTVLSLAKLPAYIVKLIDEGLKRGNASVLNDYVPTADVKFKKSMPIGAPFVVFRIISQLGILNILKNFLTNVSFIAIITLVINRVTSEKPLSISALQRRFTDSPTYLFLNSPKNPVLNVWYDALYRLELAREAILKEMYNCNPNPGKIFLYDITSSYFEGQCCPIAEWGHNRDGKKGKKQIVIGVICDSEGRPIWCDVFKGSTSDQTTVKDQLLTLKEKLDVREFIFVGDRGMLTSARLEELDSENWWDEFYYITAMKKSEILKLVENKDHPVQLELFDKELAEVTFEGERLVICYNPVRANEDKNTRERLVDKTEEKLKSIVNAVENGRLKARDKIAKRLYKWINKWNMGRFFDVKYEEGHFEYKRLDEKIERYSALDGCYIIRSNVPQKSAAKEELRKQYKDLIHVEQAFRTMKTTDINIRPIRVWNAMHVRGYVFACFLAYRVTWEIRNRLAPILKRDDTGACDAGSLQEVWLDLSDISVGALEIGDKTDYQISEMSDWQKKIIQYLKIPSILSVMKYFR